MTEQISITDDDNDRCRDNFHQNFGNFDDNDNIKNLQILLILSERSLFWGL